MLYVSVSCRCFKSSPLWGNFSLARSDINYSLWGQKDDLPNSNRASGGINIEWPKKMTSPKSVLNKRTTNMKNYADRNLVLEPISKLRTSKIYVRSWFQTQTFLLHWAILLTVEIDGANIQLHDVKIRVQTCFWEYNYNCVMSKITSWMCNAIIYVASVKTTWPLPGKVLRRKNYQIRFPLWRLCSHHFPSPSPMVHWLRQQILLR